MVRKSVGVAGALLLKMKLWVIVEMASLVSSPPLLLLSVAKKALTSVLDSWLLRVPLLFRVPKLLTVAKDSFTSVPLFTKDPELFMNAELDELANCVVDCMNRFAGAPMSKMWPFVKLMLARREPAGMERSGWPSGTPKHQVLGSSHPSER